MRINTKLFFNVFLLLILLNPGCIIFNKISYVITFNDDQGGTAMLYISDITSDATDEEAFAQDTSGLFTQMLKSNEFIDEMNKEGRSITSRRLIVNGENLDAEVKYNFNNISVVENFSHEDGFYFLTVQPVDSIISTNGQIIVSKNYKRILWDDKVKVLKFEMFSDDTYAYKKLTPYFKN